jgi:hypothetical protein
MKQNLRRDVLGRVHDARKRRNVHDRWCVLCERPLSHYSEPFSVLGRGPMHYRCAFNYAAALGLSPRVIWLPSEE